MAIDTQQLNVLFSSFKTPPFLFVGSGLARRYFATPDWEGLLREFANDISGNEFGYPAYRNKCILRPDDDMFLPTIATDIEKDYNGLIYSSKDQKWLDRRETFSNAGMNDTISPFKFSIAQKFSHADFVTPLSPEYDEEIATFRRLAAKNIGGIVTTNYDLLMQKLFPDFTAYVGQEDMLFSESQGVGEIYKIHGCCNQPQSIVIDKSDYENFNSKSTYLAAKLLTIFVERPIIFIGYGLNDNNIKTIMNAIVGGLAPHQIDSLEKRLIYVNYVTSCDQERIVQASRQYQKGSVQMTQIDLCDYRPLLKSMESIKYKFSTKLLRHIKEQVTELVKTSAPTSSIKVIDIEDNTNLDKIEFAVGVGIMATLAKRGIIGLKAPDCYKDIINNSLCKDKGFNVSDFVELGLPFILRSSPCPVRKYISLLPKGISLPERVQRQMEKENSIESFRTTTIRKSIKGHSQKIRKYRTEKYTISRLRSCFSSASLCMDHILYLADDCIDKDELLAYIKEVLIETPNILDDQCTTFRKLIRVYDFLTYSSK